MYRVVVQDAAGGFAWRDVFDGVDEARAALADVADEFPGAASDVQVFVDGPKGGEWRSVDAPPRRRGFFQRLMGR